ncbi:MAG: hypothetical protein HOV79_05820 [Hamadaea sp.]|nr:hypothetical protein [Hamadaea sp.]
MPASPADPAAAAGNVRIPLLYRASWLPDGFVEVRRDAGVTGPRPGFQLRAWAGPTAAGPGSPYVQVALLPRDGADVTHLFPELPEMGLPQVTTPSPAPRLAVRIGDRPGSAWQTPTGWVVEWYLADGTPLAVQTGHLGDSLTTALRVAASVVRDGDAAAECAVQLSWLPTALAGAPHYISTRKVADDAYRHRLSLAGDRLIVTWQKTFYPALQEFGANNKEISPPQGSIPFSFQGRSGTLMVHPRPDRRDSDHMFWVKLEAGRGMDVRGRSAVLDEGDFRRIIAGVRLGSEPYVDWIGRR